MNCASWGISFKPQAWISSKRYENEVCWLLVLLLPHWKNHYSTIFFSEHYLFWILKETRSRNLCLAILIYLSYFIKVKAFCQKQFGLGKFGSKTDQRSDYFINSTKSIFSIIQEKRSCLYNDSTCYQRGCVRCTSKIHR